MVPWTVLGPGAMGSLWAASLYRAGIPVSLLLPDHYRDRPTLALKLRDLEQQQHTLAVPYQFADAELPLEQLLVCVKAFQVGPAIAAIAHRLIPESVILLLHNGMGTLQELQPHLPPGCVVLQGTTTHGAFRHGRLNTVHAGLGETQLGLIAGHLEPKQLMQLLASLEKALPPVIWHDNIERSLWLKLAINCAINPLTALEQCRNGELRQPSRLGIVQEICAETATVMNAQGFDVSAAELFNLVRGVLDATAGNWSSMNRDMHHAQPTEIDYITGYLLRQGEQLGLDLPVNRALYEAVKMQESSVID